MMIRNGKQSRRDRGEPIRDVAFGRVWGMSDAIRALSRKCLIERESRLESESGFEVGCSRWVLFFGFPEAAFSLP